MKYAVNESGIKALHNLADTLLESSDGIVKAAELFFEAYDENKEGLGPHTASIRAILDDIKNIEDDLQDAAEDLSDKLNDIADAYQDIIDENKYDVGGKEKSCELGSAETAAGMQASDAIDLDSKQYVIYVLHELNTLQEMLDLTDGESGVLQLGGYHGKVKKDAAKVAEKFESHHIPSQGALADNADNLPTIAISKEDHKLTDSYAGKQRKRYISIFPDLEPGDAYKAGVIQMIKEGRFVEIVRDEIYNLIDQCGHKYDGGIKQYLEALRQYIEKYGVPKAKGEK